MSVRAFLRALDAAWRPRAESKTPLRIIGSTALMLQTDYARGTKDSDVVRTGDVTPETETRLLDVAGPSSKLYERQRMYIQLVPSGLLFERQIVEWLTLPELADLESFAVEVMSVLDVTITKLKRFSADDRDDVAAMVKRGLFTHEALVAAFRAAVDFTDDAKADDLSRCRRNLHRIECDMLDIDEPTEVELPSWVEDD